MREDIEVQALIDEGEYFLTARQIVAPRRGDPGDDLPGESFFPTTLQTTLQVWTDGSCNAGGVMGRGGWAVLIDENGVRHQITGSAEGTTHNRMELTAVCEALEAVTGRPVVVRTDSTYVLKLTRPECKPLKNLDLVARIQALLTEGVTFEWIKGHSGNEGNNYVDKAARISAEGHPG